MYQTFDKQTYKEYKALAKEQGVTFGVAEYYDSLDYIAVSVAFAPATSADNCRMLDVSVSYCSPQDTYKPKVGKFQVLNKFFAGVYISLPLNHLLLEIGEEEMLDHLLALFTV